MTDAAPPVPRLAVCLTCRAGEIDCPLEARPGRELHQALLQRSAGEVELMAVECLSLCDHGCSAAISAPGKWSYLLGDLRPELADDILTYARAYSLSKTGLVLPSKRPVSLASMVKGRMPSV